MTDITSLTWEGNSRAMYDKMMASAPVFMRDKARKKFEQWVDQRAVTALTETLIEEHVNEVLPPQFRGMLLAQLAGLKTGASA